jgi:hypothetical protein
MRNTSWRFSTPRQHGNAWHMKHKRQLAHVIQIKHDGHNTINIHNETHIDIYSYHPFHFRHFISFTFNLFPEMHKIIIQSPIFRCLSYKCKSSSFVIYQAITAVLLRILVFRNEMLLFVWFPLFWRMGTRHPSIQWHIPEEMNPQFQMCVPQLIRIKSYTLARSRSTTNSLKEAVN